MSDIVREVLEVFWVVQYETGDAYRGTLRWWPEAGEGKYNSEESATVALDADQYSHRRRMRVVKVERRTTFGEAVVRDLS